MRCAHDEASACAFLLNLNLAAHACRSSAQCRPARTSTTPWWRPVPDCLAFRAYCAMDFAVDSPPAAAAAAQVSCSSRPRRTCMSSVTSGRPLAMGMWPPASHCPRIGGEPCHRPSRGGQPSGDHRAAPVCIAEMRTCLGHLVEFSSLMITCHIHTHNLLHSLPGKLGARRQTLSAAALTSARLPCPLDCLLWKSSSFATTCMVKVIVCQPTLTLQ